MPSNDEQYPPSERRIRAAATDAIEVVRRLNKIPGYPKLSIREDGSGLSIFEDRANSPSVFVDVGAAYAKGALRPKLTLYRQELSLSDDTKISDVAKSLRFALKDRGFIVELVSNFPKLHLSKNSGAFYQQGHNPLICGSSISLIDHDLDGALGFFAIQKAGSWPVGDEDAQQDRRVLVTAGHVLVDGTAGGRDRVVHPGQGVSTKFEVTPRIIASGARGYFPAPNIEIPVDAAVASLVSYVDVDNHSTGNGHIVEWLSESELSPEEFEDARFIKVGPGTGTRFSTFSQFKPIQTFSLQSPKGKYIGKFSVKNLFELETTQENENFSKNTDSGAPVLIEKEKEKFILCGIIIGGHRISKNRSLSYVCPISEIKAHLNLEPIRPFAVGSTRGKEQSP